MFGKNFPGKKKFRDKKNFPAPANNCPDKKLSHQNNYLAKKFPEQKILGKKGAGKKKFGSFSQRQKFFFHQKFFHTAHIS